MEVVIIAVIIIAGMLIYFNRNKGLDVNEDGKIDLADAKAAVDNTIAGVKKVADVNGDGKVTVKDAKVVAQRTQQAVRKASPRNRPSGNNQPRKATPKK